MVVEAGRGGMTGCGRLVGLVIAVLGKPGRRAGLRPVAKRQAYKVQM